MAKKKRAAEPEPTFVQKALRAAGLGSAPTTEQPPAAAEVPPRPLGAHIREWTDAIVIATIVAMMVRTFVVEPFKIPSGSMSPALLGDLVAEGYADGSDGKGAQFLFIARARRWLDKVQVYRKDEAGTWKYLGWTDYGRLSFSQQKMIQANSHVEEHRILVNRFAYWFSGPKRGDVAVFRVPFELNPTTFTVDGVEREVRAFNRSQPVYVKRVIGLPGEEVTILGNQRRVAINGKLLDSPKPFDHNDYFLPPNMVTWNYKLPDDGYALFGDNSDNSEDSRYWGPVPHQNLRGKAFLVYWPWKRIGFLTGG